LDIFPHHPPIIILYLTAVLQGTVTVSNTSGYVTRVGGFAGSLGGTGTVDRCFSSGIGTSNNGGYVGGFVGNAYEVVITDSYTVSNLSVASTSAVAAFSAVLQQLQPINQLLHELMLPAQ
jgi:hypothetical protein